MLVIGRAFYLQGEQKKAAEMLRNTLIERYLCKKGNAMLFRTEDGRPMLTIPGADISTTHSHGLVMVALSIPYTLVSLQKKELPEGIGIEEYPENFHRVGIDAELLTDEDCEKYRKIAERWFCTDEKAYLESIQPEALYREAFFRMWTQKESVCKLTGEGISAIRDVNTLALPEGMTVRNRLLRTQNGVYVCAFCGETACHADRLAKGL